MVLANQQSGSKHQCLNELPIDLIPYLLGKTPQSPLTKPPTTNKSCIFGRTSETPSECWLQWRPKPDIISILVANFPSKHSVRHLKLLFHFPFAFLELHFRCSLKSSGSGGGGTCRGFWAPTPNTTSLLWQATAAPPTPRSPCWPNAAPPHPTSQATWTTSPAFEMMKWPNTNKSRTLPHSWV